MFTTRKVAAVAAATALTISGATGVANAQESSEGSLDTSSLTGGSAEGSSGSGDSAGDGSVEDLGSIILDADALGTGSIDTENSSLGEPTTGSLSDSVSQGIASTGTNSLTPADGTGSVDTTGSVLGEPTTGSLAPIYAPIAGSLGIGEGATTVLGSSGGGSTGALLPAALGVGSIAAIGAGIYFAPEIHAALTNAGIQLPPLPPLPWAPAQDAAPAAPAPAPAPGPGADNGRG